MNDVASIELITQAVREIAPEPRKSRWTSLSFCVLDAVFSIGANYDLHVVPTINRVADALAVDTRVVPATAPLGTDPVPLDRFVEKFRSEDDLLEATQNRQRTSTTNGITKASATLRYAEILNDCDVRTLEDARLLLADAERFLAVDRMLGTVPGDGSSGIRRGYLWMLVGDHDAIKPDRMVLRWLAERGVSATADEARSILIEVAARLSADGATVTPWEVDHAIWRTQRTNPGLTPDADA